MRPVRRGLLVTSCAGALLAAACSQASDAVDSAGPAVPSTFGVPDQSTVTTVGATVTTEVTTAVPPTSPPVSAPATTGGIAASTTTTFLPATSAPQSTSPPATATPPTAAAPTTATPATLPITTPAGATVAQLDGIRLGYQGGNVDRVVFDFAGGVPAAYTVDYGSAPVGVAGDNVIVVRMAPATSAAGNTADRLSGSSLNGVQLVAELARASDAGNELAWALGVKGRPRFTHVADASRIVVNIFP